MNKLIILILIVSLLGYSNALNCNYCNNCFYTGVQTQTCAIGQNYCFVTQTNDKIDAGCAATCVSGANVKCCTGNNCNAVPRPAVCNACTNCFYSSVISQTCAYGQNYCYVTQNGANVNSGCAATCVPGTNTKCCTGTNCNPIPRLLTCNTCSNCYSNPITLQTCDYNQNYCYTQQTGNAISAGCSASCIAGANTRCCTSVGCNPVPKALTCNTCTNCLYSQAFTQTCSANQNYCYVQQDVSSVTAGCAASCVTGANTKCCQTGNCNTIPTPLQCYTCDNCKFNYFSTVQTCAAGQNYCFKETYGNNVRRGCAATCVQGTNTRCCTSSRCNKSSLLVANSVVLSIILFIQILLQ